VFSHEAAYAVSVHRMASEQVGVLSDPASYAELIPDVEDLR